MFLAKVRLSPALALRHPLNALRYSHVACSSKTVHLRIEGGLRTIYEGSITTSPHKITLPDGTTYQCDGTNNGYNAKPGATVTTALDDASQLKRFSWNGKWYKNLQDFLITEIAGETPAQGDKPEYWSLWRNWEGLKVGGCQQKVQDDDEVLIALYGGSVNKILRLQANNWLGREVRLGVDKEVTVKVSNQGAVVNGASVNGQTTDNNGEAKFKFGSKGEYDVKATHKDGVRSNAIRFIVE